MPKSKSKSKTFGEDIGEYKCIIDIEKEKSGCIPWSVTVYNEDGDIIASFVKGIDINDYLITIKGNNIPINHNGVKASYDDWNEQIKQIINSDITWYPSTRKMWKYIVVSE